MKFATVLIFTLLLFVIGCTVTQQIEIPSEQPELVGKASLPPLTSALFTDGVKFNVLLHVLNDGSVENVRMLGSSGDKEWDAQALQSIRQWRFAPPRRDGAPVDLWFRQLIIVQVQEPVVMTIGELACTTRQQADSLFTLLQQGHPLDDLFNTTLTTVDVMQYPQRAREELKKLHEGQYTHPVRIGDMYMIYKRFPKDVVKSPVL
ncbi:MAG TPA: energy transducer TonB [Bacteroidota bacterium]